MPFRNTSQTEINYKSTPRAKQRGNRKFSSSSESYGGSGIRGRINDRDNKQNNDEDSYCPLPYDQQIMNMDSNWIQILPSASTDIDASDPPKSVSNVVNNNHNGWAIDPRNKHGCVEGEYCPYACNSGYIETQYHRENNIEKQGIYCHNTAIQFKGNSNSIPEYNKQFCIKTPNSVAVINNTDFTVTFCRENSGLKIPHIPTLIEPGQMVYLTTLPSCQDPQWASTFGQQTCFQNYNNGDIWLSSSIKYYVSRADEKALTPVCQFNRIRPSTVNDNNHGGDASVNGTDYYPYIVQIRGIGDVIMNSNNDLLSLKCGGYDRSLGNPGFGLRMYEADINPNNFKGGIEYQGPSAPNRYTTLCNSNGCADKEVYPIRLTGDVDNPFVETDCNSLQLGIRGVTQSSDNPIIIEIYESPNRFIINPQLCQSNVCGLDLNFSSTDDNISVSRNTVNKISDAFGSNYIHSNPNNTSTRLGSNFITNSINTPITKENPVNNRSKERDIVIPKSSNNSSKSTWVWILIISLILLFVIIGVLIYVFFYRNKKPEVITNITQPNNGDYNGQSYISSSAYESPSPSYISSPYLSSPQIPSSQIPSSLITSKSPVYIPGRQNLSYPPISTPTNLTNAQQSSTIPLASASTSIASMSQTTPTQMSSQSLYNTINRQQGTLSPLAPSTDSQSQSNMSQLGSSILNTVNGYTQNQLNMSQLGGSTLSQTTSGSLNNVAGALQNQSINRLVPINPINNQYSINQMSLPKLLNPSTSK